MKGRPAMQSDFHYYAAYCAASLADYSHRESLEIAYADQFTDCCSRTLLDRINGPMSAATTQLRLEMMEADTTPVGLQDITRIWASFHFLPGDLRAVPGRKCSRRYLNKYRLICGPNGELAAETVELARGRGTAAAGLAMHVLSDTWAHRYFAGTPSLVINNTSDYFYELIPDESGTGFTEREVNFNHNPMSPDDPDKGIYTNSLQQSEENSIMNLGHGRCGHFPDYSFARYRYMPAWGDYREIVKDNPYDYLHAFCQMIYALQSLRNEKGRFMTGLYAVDEIRPWVEDIGRLLRKRQISASADWKALGEKITGQDIPDFDEEKYLQEYMDAPEDAKDDTFLGKFILAALAQKSMVTHRIFESGSLLAGFSVDFTKKGFRGIGDFRSLVRMREREKGA